MPYVKIRICEMDAQGRVVRDCKAHEIGMVVLGGPGIAGGYLNPSQNEGVFLPGGWLVTGDLGSLDEEGYIRISGRQKDLIIRSGHNILIITDRRLGADRVAIPALLALSAVHHHLVREGLRTTAGLVVADDKPKLEISADEQKLIDLTNKVTDRLWVFIGAVIAGAFLVITHVFVLLARSRGHGQGHQGGREGRRQQHHTVARRPRARSRGASRPASAEGRHTLRR